MFTSAYWMLLRNCFLTVVLFYGTLHVLFEMIQTIIPIGMILVALVSLLLYLIRIPPPDKADVDAVLGTQDESENDTNHLLKSVAHRGAGLDAPENSLEAFEMCYSKGCKAIEFDVTLTSDNIAIVFHDRTLESMTDLNLVVNHTPWEELKTVDISVKHPFKSKFSGVRIPSFTQAVELLLRLKEMHMIIDIKDNNRKFVHIILDLFKTYPELHSRAIVTTFFPNLIYFIRRDNPTIVCSLSWRPKFYSHVYSLQSGIGERRTTNIFKHLLNVVCDNLHEWFLPRLTYNILGISAILLHKDIISLKVVEQWRTKGVRVFAWTVNQPVEKQYFTRSLKITYLTDTLTGESSVHTAL